jgi:hypothetical protein
MPEKQETMLPVWLVCQSAFKNKTHRLRPVVPDRAHLALLSSAMQSAVDDCLVSAGLSKLGLIHPGPSNETFHTFGNTVAGLAMLKLPGSLANFASSFGGR